MNTDTCNYNSAIADSKLSNSIQYILNGFMHVSILFTFLTFLFIVIISEVTKDVFREELGTIIESNIDHILPEPIQIKGDSFSVKNKRKDTIKKFIDIYNNSSSYINNITDDDINNILNNTDKIYNVLSTNNIETLFDNYIKQYSNPNYIINLHDNDIIFYSKYISIIFLIISAILITVVKISCPKCLNVTKLLVENVLTFAFVGGIEYWFFMNFAMHFIPAPPSLLFSSAVDAIKQNLKN
jgi:hypothetical protein